MLCCKYCLLKGGFGNRRLSPSGQSAGWPILLPQTAAKPAQISGLAQTFVHASTYITLEKLILVALAQSAKGAEGKGNPSDLLQQCPRKR